MVKGLYTAHTGMVNEMKRLDILANNLANADTTAYKKKERRVVLLPMRCLCALRILLTWGFRKAWRYYIWGSPWAGIYGLFHGKFQGDR